MCLLPCQSLRQFWHTRIRLTVRIRLFQRSIKFFHVKDLQSYHKFQFTPMLDDDNVDEEADNYKNDIDDADVMNDNWDLSRANFLSKVGQNSNIYKER